MRQYWINYNGKQDGPMSLEQIAQMGVDETAYVWHSGLPDWVRITEVTELNEMLQQARYASQQAQEQAPEIPQQAQELAPEMPQQTQEQAPEMPQQVQEQAPEMPQQTQEQAPEMPQQTQELAPEMPQQAQEQAPEMPHVVYTAQGPVFPAQHPMPEEAPKCPPTNLVWAIITTLLCCTPAGIVGIVFAFMTKKHYREGNYEKAQKMSDYGAWAIIFAITCAFQGIQSMQDLPF